MKKLIREDGLVLILSVVMMYLTFQVASGWEWHFLAAALFSMVVGVAGGVLTQVLMMIYASKRGGTASADSDEVEAGERRSGERFEATDEDSSASGTGADESGPRGPVNRPEEYRSSLEDPN